MYYLLIVGIFIRVGKEILQIYHSSYLTFTDVEVYLFMICDPLLYLI